MKQRLFTGIVLMVLALCFQHYGHAQTKVIKAAALLNPQDGSITRSPTVIVKDGIISQVGYNLEVPAGAEVIDLGSQTIMPGLMDMHTHLCWHTHSRKNDGYVLSIVREPTAYRAIQGVMNARDMLMAGFTTVRDVGNSGNYADAALRMAIEDGLVPGPTMVNAGRIISPFGGQRWVTPERPTYTQPEYYFADTRDELRKAIRENIHYGAKLIKLVLDDQKYQYSQEDIEFVVAEAADAGMKVAAHCATEKGALRAIAAGVASVEHGFGLTEPSMEVLAKSQIPFVSTTFSLPVLESMASDLSHAPDTDYASGVATLRLAYEKGAFVAFGSDVISEVPGMDRGQATLSYIKSFQDAGVTNLQIIQAMTINAMHTVGFEGQRGLIAEGYAADIIAMPGNPMSDIEQLKQVSFVMKDGEVYKHE